MAMEQERVVKVSTTQEYADLSTSASEDGFHPMLTRVESLISSDASAVPAPVVQEGPLPECGVYTGPGYGRSVVVPKSVDLTEEKIVYKSVKRQVVRPVEVVVTVPKVITKQRVEFKKIVDESDVIEVPKPYPVEVRKFVPHFVDTPQRVVLKDSNKKHVVYDSFPQPVECTVAEPEIHVVDIMVPKVVDGYFVCKKGLTELRRVDEISQAKWNSLVLKMNPDLCRVGDLDLLPVHRNANGDVIAYKPHIEV